MLAQSAVVIGRRYGATEGQLGEGLSAPLDELCRPGASVPWDDYCVLAERVTALAEKTPGGDRPFGPEDPFLQRFAVLAGLLNNPAALTSAVVHFVLSVVTPLKTQVGWEDDGRMRVELSIDPTARGCAALLRMLVHRTRALPALLELPPPQIDHELTPHRLCMRLRFAEPDERPSAPSAWESAFADLKVAQGALRRLFERMPSAVALVRGERLLFGNSAWLKLTGAGALERAVGGPVLDRLHPADRPAFRSLLGGGASSEEPLRFVRPDGSVRYGRVLSTDEFELLGGKTLCLVLGDVTEQRRNELLQKTLLEMFPDTVYRVHADGTVLAAGGRTSSDFPVPAEQLEGKKLAELQTSLEGPAEWVRQAQALVQRTVESQAPHQIEVGWQRTYEVRAYPLSSDEALVVARDLTEQRALQAKVMLSERMAALGTLAAGVAHEVNNPLTYVMGNLNLARRALGRSPPDCSALGATLDEAFQGAQRVARIVADLRAFTRGDDSTTGPVSVVEVVDAALRMVAGTMRSQGELEREVQGEFWVAGNEARLAQVLLNLLVNALQALPEQPGRRGLVRVVVRPRGARQVEIAVHDNGHGMAPEVRERIFDPFFTTKPVGVGTGLGLSICHRLVTSMGGDIEVTSKPDQGSTFTVVLPVASPPPSPAPAAVQSSPGRRARVLVVDDEPLVAHVLRRILDGHELTVVTTGQEALAQLETQPFDAVFCDVMMPGLSGVDVYERLPPERRRGFVFMTGGGGPELLAFLNRSGRPWLQKPFSLEQVEAALARVLEAG